MNFEPNGLYHIYNRSNEIVFYNRDNYLYFLSKIKKHIYPVSNILAWVLMPNHFHILIQANEKSCISIGQAHRCKVQNLSAKFGTVLSSYTQAINKQTGRKGKLFAHNTKAKNLNEITFYEMLSRSNSTRLAHMARPDYVTTCFLYIHQNPVLAGLCSKLSDWEFSSFRDFAGMRTGSLINKNLAKEIIELDFDNFESQSQFLIDEEILKKIV